MQPTLPYLGVRTKKSGMSNLGSNSVCVCRVGKCGILKNNSNWHLLLLLYQTPVWILPLKLESNPEHISGTRYAQTL